MDDNLTDKQQIELLKKLWKEYGIAIVMGTLIAITVAVGWKFYKHYTTQHAQQASVVYERMMVDVMTHQIEDAKKQSDILIHQFSQTPYATLAVFTAAKFAVDAQQFDEAIQHLIWVIEHSHQQDFRQIARIRLARVYLAQNKTKEALETLEKVDNPAFKPLILQVKGDIYLQLGEINKAQDAYKTGLNKLPDQASMRPLLQMKLENLPSKE